MLRYSMLFAALLNSRRGTHWADSGHGLLSDARDVPQCEPSPERSLRPRSRPTTGESLGLVGSKAPPVGPDTVVVSVGVVVGAGARADGRPLCSSTTHENDHHRCSLPETQCLPCAFSRAHGKLSLCRVCAKI